MCALHMAHAPRPGNMAMRPLRPGSQPALDSHPYCLHSRQVFNRLFTLLCHSPDDLGGATGAGLGGAPGTAVLPLVAINS